MPYKQYDNQKRGYNNASWKKDGGYHGGNNAPVEIKTPYNFTPISDKVFFPTWADKVSQDVPFGDGISGTIAFDIVAEAPVGILSGIRDTDGVLRPCRTPDHRYFIPGTAIKGEIRNVLDIMSFGKIKNVRNDRFGLRNINNRSYRENMKNVRCGWMKKNEDGVVLKDCGVPGRISLDTIDRHFGTHISPLISDRERLKSDEHRTARYKYSLAHPDVYSELCEFVEDTELQMKMQRKNPVDNREFYKFAGPEGECYYGKIVFTGQSGARYNDPKTGKMTGKAFEFIFFDLDGEEVILPVPEQLFKDFESIYAQSPDYVGFWKSKLEAGEEIPVFFKMEGEHIHSIGLSYMYKYPYKKSIYDAIPAAHLDSSRQDLSECMFGFEADNQALRGRVQFGHAICSDAFTLDQERKIALSAPRASFYPFYVKDGKDWNNAELISGFKRYPVRSSINDSQGTDAMTSRVQMLGRGTVFHEIIRFHNLRPIEIGALLSAISFHNNSVNCFHNIGYAKPLGFGKVSIRDLSLKDRRGNQMDAIQYMATFEICMNNFLGTSWVQTPQMQELVLMARGIPSGQERCFSYLQKPKDFAEIKKRSGEVLKPFSKRIQNGNGVIDSLLPSNQ